MKKKNVRIGTVWPADFMDSIENNKNVKQQQRFEYRMSSLWNMRRCIDSNRWEENRLNQHGMRETGATGEPRH